LDKNKYSLYFIRITLFVAIVLWMLIIFGFSAADGSTSQSLSDKITAVVIDIFVKDYQQLEEVLQEDVWNKYSFVVRKVGHFGEYTIFGMLLAGFSLTYPKVQEDKRLLLINLIVGFLYSISDEIHQGFVDGRSPKTLDVFIDTLGVSFGVSFLLFFFVVYIKRRLKSI